MEDIQAARKAALAFETKMRLEILDRVNRNEDPVAVYLAYADNAPGWAKDISDVMQIDFSRTALEVRNPAATPDAWEQRQMEQFNYMADAGLDLGELEAAEIVQEGETSIFRWMRPMVMEGPCLTCHGDQIDPRVRLLLLQEYPSDAATGYYEGQIGGAYSVKKVLSVNGKPPPPYQPTPLAPRLEEREPGDAPLVLPPQDSQQDPSLHDPPPPDEFAPPEPL